MQRQLREISKAPKSTERPSLIDWIAKVSPELDRFDYFAPYAEAFEQCIGGELRLAFAAPPQHGKSTVTLYGLLWLATFFPGYQHAYVTYNATRAEEVAKEFRRIAESVGMQPLGTLDKVDFAGGTSVKFTSVGASLTGYPITGVCIIDDPIKDAKDARSATIRRDVVEWYKSVARTRRHKGTSYIVMATRWHVEDLTGYLVSREKWRYLNFKALAEAANDNDVDADGRVVSDPIHRRVGESLWSRKPPEFFAEERADAYWWYAMYQGEPRPIGGEIFHAPTYYRPDQLPQKGFRIAYGVDLSYSKKTHSDFSVVVEVLAVKDPKLTDKEGKPVTWFYVVDVVRKQVEAPEFTLTLKAKHSHHPAKFYWYAAGTEKGSADFIRAKGIPLKTLDPHGRDKLMRAQRTAELWNLGRIMLPMNDGDEDGESSVPWVSVFADEVTSFTGVNDSHDDQVDALVPAIDKLERGGDEGGLRVDGGSIRRH